MSDSDLRTVVVIDDDRSCRELLGAFLHALGYRFRTFSRVQDAVGYIESVGAEAIRAVLTDIMMPHETGLDALLYLKNNMRFTKVPVVVVSSVRPKLYSETFSVLGVRAVVQKPFTDKRIAEVMKSLRSP